MIVAMNGTTIGITYPSILILLVLFGTCFGDKTIPASFVFGDSLIDAGNNNYIKTLAKGNFKPYGIDFGKPTGRFTNGRTVVDIIGQELGLKEFTPPYLDPTTTGPVVLRGVNYASGAGGILKDSGSAFGGRIDLDTQLDYFAKTKKDIIEMIGANKTTKLVEEAIFTLEFGCNDILNNYLLPINHTTLEQDLTPKAFLSLLISTFRLQIKRLYDMGARKFVVTNVSMIGCIPFQRELHPLSGEECASFPNYIAQMFNEQLQDLVAELNTNLSRSRFVYADVYRVFNDIIQDYQSYGFENMNSSCCSTFGRFGGLIPCNRSSKVCPDRSKYVFWDSFHPTDAVNAIVAKRLVDGGPRDVSPINIRQLVALVLNSDPIKE